MSQEETTPTHGPDQTVSAIRELSQSFHQLAIALSIVAREGARAEEIAERAQNASAQAVTIAREVRELARSIDRKIEAHQRAMEDFFTRSISEFANLSRRVKTLEDAKPKAEEANGQG